MIGDSNLKAISPSTRQKLNWQQRCLLKGIWNLDKETKNLLDFQKTHICSISTFMASVESEQFPKTYEDTFFLHTIVERPYYISYLFCSGLYLEELQDARPETPLAYQLRSNFFNNFHYCVVRTWDSKWTKDWLLKNGAVEVGKVKG